MNWVSDDGRMNWMIVARADVTNALQSRTLRTLSAVFVAIAVLVTVSYAYVVRSATAGGAPVLVDLLAHLSAPASVLVPLLGIVLGYEAIADDRKSGHLALLLSLSHTRSDVVLGKFLGRVAVLVGPLLAAFGVAAVLVVALFESFPVLEFATFLLVTAALGATYVAIAVGVSAATGSTFRALGGALGLFVLFQFLWNDLLLGVYVLVTGEFAVGERPDWLLFLWILNPGNGYTTVLEGTILPQEPLPVKTWFALALLLAWIPLSLCAGILRFRSQDR